MGTEAIFQFNKDVFLMTLFHGSTGEQLVFMKVIGIEALLVTEILVLVLFFPSAQKWRHVIERAN
jgi:hypothetical protein